MPRLDELVRDAVDGLVEQVPVDAVFAGVNARRTSRRRTRRALVAVGVAAVVGIVATATQVREDPPAQVLFAGQPEETTTVPASPAIDLPPFEPNEGFALWPEDTAAEWRAAGEKPAWRLDPIDTVRHFAADVLGWPDVAPEQVMTDADGRHYRIAREPGGPVEIVHLEQLQPCDPAQRGCPALAWSVLAVSDDPMPCEDPALPECFTLAMSVQAEEAYLAFGMLDAAVADVEVSYGTPVRGSTSTGEITLTLARDPADPGYLLLMFRDPQGLVFRAFGYTLGPGDTAVG